MEQEKESPLSLAHLTDKKNAQAAAFFRHGKMRKKSRKKGAAKLKTNKKTAPCSVDHRSTGMQRREAQTRSRKRPARTKTKTTPQGGL